MPGSQEPEEFRFTATLQSWHKHCQSQIWSEWVRFQEVNIQEKDSHMRVDHKVSLTKEMHVVIQVLPKLVKCACPCKCNVERSLSVNKRVLTKEKTDTDWYYVKAAIAIHGDVTKCHT